MAGWDGHARLNVIGLGLNTHGTDGWGDCLDEHPLHARQRLMQVSHACLSLHHFVDELDDLDYVRYFPNPCIASIA